MDFTYEAKYCLTKLSSRSFTLYTDHEEVVTSILATYCCQTCREECGYSLDDLLNTSCGAEFMLEENVKVTETS